jgi:hypothetical protein
MPSLTENSYSWGWKKVTIAAGPASTAGPDCPCRSCRVFHYSGTATFMSYTTATANDIPLPTSSATSLNVPVRNLNTLHFIGTANDVVMIIWRD